MTTNYADNKKVFRFPHFDSSHEMEKLKLEAKKAKVAEIIARNPKTHDIQVGRNILPDQTAFNKMFETVLNVNRYQRDIKKKLKYIRLGDKPIDYTKFSIQQIKEGLYIDFFDMCNELLIIDKFNFHNLNAVLSKNYRKVTILLLILFILLISFVLMNILNK